MSTQRIASAFPRMTSASVPRRGRLDAISTSGFAPPDSTAVHIDAGSVPSRVPPATLTQTEPPAAASDCAAATEVVFVIAFVRPSTRVTFPSR